MKLNYIYSGSLKALKKCKVAHLAMLVGSETELYIQWQFESIEEV